MCILNNPIANPCRFLQQTNRNIEYVIVDGASTEDSTNVDGD